MGNLSLRAYFGKILKQNWAQTMIQSLCKVAFRQVKLSRERKKPYFLVMVEIQYFPFALFTETV